MRSLLEIYRDGFPEDGDEYAAWFVKQYANCAVTLSEDGEPVAAGYLLGKSLRCGGTTLPVCYLDAFSVFTPYRGRGLSAALMRKLVARAKAENAQYLLLNPFDGTYYRQYGFTDLVCADYRTVTGGTAYPIRPAAADDVRAVYAAATADANVYLARTDEFYADCARDHLLVGGFAVGTVWQDEFEVTACADYAALLLCDGLRGLRVAVPGGKTPFVQALALTDSPYRLTGKIVLTDKL